MKPTKRYDGKIDLSADTVYTRILNLVGEGKRVLDVGCATGNLARALAEANHCTVTGIEIDPSAAEEAKRWCERVVVGDIESLDLETVLAGARVDVIIFADVLEHLVNPSRVLADAKKVLADGCVVASLPNVAHSAVVLELLRGRFQYRALGLLDDTHLRFFGKWDVVELFEKAGYAIESFQRVYVAPEDTELGVNVDRYPAELVRLLETNDEATTYQFVVKARVAHGGAPGQVVGATSAEARGILGHIKLLNEDRAVWRAQAEAVGEDRDHWRQQAAAVEGDRDQWRQQAAAVEADRDGWRQQAAAVEGDRDHWRQQAEAVQADRDGWRERAEAVEADRDRWRERAAAVEADRDGWRQQAAAAMEKMERLHLTVESMAAQAKAKEADWELWLKRYYELEERLGSIERVPAYRLYRALRALVRRFWNIR